MEHTCQHCGKPMPPGKRRHAKTCSGACRVGLHYARHRADRLAERDRQREDHERREAARRPWVPPWHDGERPTIEDLIAAEREPDPFAVVGQVIGA